MKIEKISNAMMQNLNGFEMGKLVGGAAGGTATGAGSYTLPDGTISKYSADCTLENGGDYYGYTTDSAAGWKNPCD